MDHARAARRPPGRRGSAGRSGCRARSPRRRAGSARSGRSPRRRCRPGRTPRAAPTCCSPTGCARRCARSAGPGRCSRRSSPAPAAGGPGAATATPASPRRPRPSPAGRRTPRAAARSSPAPGRASSSTKAMIDPLAWAMPVLRAPEAPPVRGLSSTRTSGNSSRARASSPSLWSTTRIVSSGGTVWCASASMPATMSSHRSIVWAATTTETSGGASGGVGLLTAVVPAVAGPGGRPGAELRAAAQGAVGAAAVVLVRVGRVAARAALGPRPAGGQVEHGVLAAPGTSDPSPMTNAPSRSSRVWQRKRRRGDRFGD